MKLEFEEVPNITGPFSLETTYTEYEFVNGQMVEVNSHTEKVKYQSSIPETLANHRTEER